MSKVVVLVFSLLINNFGKVMRHFIFDSQGRDFLALVELQKKFRAHILSVHVNKFCL